MSMEQLLVPDYARSFSPVLRARLLNFSKLDTNAENSCPISQLKKRTAKSLPTLLTVFFGLLYHYI